MCSSDLKVADSESPFRADAHFLLASAQQARANHVDAARELVAVLNSNPDAELQEEVLDRLEDLMKGPAAYRANEFLAMAADKSITRILRRMLPVSAEQPTIGLLIPDEGGGWEDADALIAGVEAALDLWEADGGVEIRLEIERVASEPARAVIAARKLVRELGVWALITAGPSELTVPAAVEAQAAGVPVIFPGEGCTALEGIGPSVVRTIADWYTEGELAATYAADVLRLKTFGIVAPYTDRGRESVAGFLNVLEQHEDVEILDQEWYRPEEGVSLAMQFRNLRTIGFIREFRDQMVEKEIARMDSIAAALDSMGVVEVDARIDSLRLTVVDTLAEAIVLRSMSIDSLIIPDEQLEREWQQHLIEGRKTIEFKTGNVDSNAIALSIYDGLYLPIAQNSLTFFAPQFAFYEFNTVRLGNSAWHEPDELLRHHQYVERVILTSPVELRSNNEAMLDLYYQLVDTVNTELTEWNVHGYDAARLILCALTDGSLDDTLNTSMEIVRTGPLSLAMGLRSLKSAKLASGDQTFAEDSPVALGMWMLSVEDGIAFPLTDGLQTVDSLKTADPPYWAIPLVPELPDSLMFESIPADSDFDTGEIE